MIERALGRMRSIERPRAYPGASSASESRQASKACRLSCVSEGRASERAPRCVFKGGTSLSKCHHAIDRFSEDIDITFAEYVTLGQRHKLKHETIAGISETLSEAAPILEEAACSGMFS